MSAHEFMNMARVRAEQAEAEAARLREQFERLKGEREEAHAQRELLEERIARMRPVIQAARDEVYEGERDESWALWDAVRSYDDALRFHRDEEPRAEKAQAERDEARNVAEWLLRDFLAATPSAESYVSVSVARDLFHRLEAEGWKNPLAPPEAD